MKIWIITVLVTLLLLVTGRWAILVSDITSEFGPPVLVVRSPVPLRTVPYASEWFELPCAGRYEFGFVWDHVAERWIPAESVDLTLGQAHRNEAGQQALIVGGSAIGGWSDGLSAHVTRLETPTFSNRAKEGARLQSPDDIDPLKTAGVVADSTGTSRSLLPFPRIRRVWLLRLN